MKGEGWAESAGLREINSAQAREDLGLDFEAILGSSSGVRFYRVEPEEQYPGISDAVEEEAGLPQHTPPVWLPRDLIAPYGAGLYPPPTTTHPHARPERKAALYGGYLERWKGLVYECESMQLGFAINTYLRTGVPRHSYCAKPVPLEQFFADFHAKYSGLIRLTVNTAQDEEMVVRFLDLLLEKASLLNEAARARPAVEAVQPLLGAARTATFMLVHLFTLPGNRGIPVLTGDRLLAAQWYDRDTVVPLLVAGPYATAEVLIVRTELLMRWLQAGYNAEGFPKHLGTLLNQYMRFGDPRSTNGGEIVSLAEFFHMFNRSYENKVYKLVADYQHGAGLPAVKLNGEVTEDTLVKAIGALHDDYLQARMVVSTDGGGIESEQADAVITMLMSKFTILLVYLLERGKHYLLPKIVYAKLVEQGRVPHGTAVLASINTQTDAIRRAAGGTGGAKGGSSRAGKIGACIHADTPGVPLGKCECCTGFHGCAACHAEHVGTG